MVYRKAKAKNIHSGELEYQSNDVGEWMRGRKEKRSASAVTNYEIVPGVYTKVCNIDRYNIFSNLNVRKIVNNEETMLTL